MARSQISIQMTVVDRHDAVKVNKHYRKSRERGAEYRDRLLQVIGFLYPLVMAEQGCKGENVERKILECRKGFEALMQTAKDCISGEYVVEEQPVISKDFEDGF